MRSDDGIPARRPHTVEKDRVLLWTLALYALAWIGITAAMLAGWI